VVRPHRYGQVRNRIRALLPSRIPQGVVILGASSLIGVAIAYFREATVAYFFGTSTDLDTFLVALTLPRLLTVNAVDISVGVVLPAYAGLRHLGKNAAAAALVQNWFLLSAVVLGAACTILLVGAGPTIHLLAPGFSPVRRAESARWLRLLMPYAWILGVSGVCKVVLDSNGRFAIPVISNQLGSVCVIAACAASASVFGVGAVAVGLVAGAMLTFTWQLRAARQVEPRLGGLSLLSPGAGLPIAAAGSMLMNSFALQTDVVVDRSFASVLPAGSIAAYYYAQTIASIPTAVLTSALVTALFPVFSRMLAEGDWTGSLRTAVRWSVALALLCLGPAIALVVLREPLVTVLFKRGEFTNESLKMTARVLSVLPYMVVISSVSAVATSLLLAQRRAGVVAALSILAVGLKVGLNVVLVPRAGLYGLAMATVITGATATTVRILLASSRSLPRFRGTGSAS
jgi:putative peptidoglycan lipid II flippase